MTQPHEPEWLKNHRERQPFRWPGGGKEMDYPSFSIISGEVKDPPRLLRDEGFNNHTLNDGKHVSPYDRGTVHVGTEGLRVDLIQGVDEASFRRVLSEALRATTGISPDDNSYAAEDTDEMMKGGLQAALETQTIVFRVIGASRALTHQLVRSRQAGFHQQSQRATWYGDRPDVRMPLSVFRVGLDPDAIWPTKPELREAWDEAIMAAWKAYKMACDAGVSYQDARYILPEGTTNYIMCEYTIKEFIAVFAYRGCSMFLWEMVDCMRKMRKELIAAHPFLEPYVKISCEKPIGDCDKCGGQGVEFVLGADNDRLERSCSYCGGDGKARKCTFQGWENVENVCDFPWAKQDNRVFLPNPKNRIGG